MSEIERVGFQQMTATSSGVQGVNEISALEQCEAAVVEFLRRVNTRPGPDDEVLIQVIVRQERSRGIREAIADRLDR